MRSGKEVRCCCQTCGQISFRVFKGDGVGWGQCRRVSSGDRPCGGTLVPARNRTRDHKLARARADVAAQNEEG